MDVAGWLQSVEESHLVDDVTSSSLPPFRNDTTPSDLRERRPSRHQHSKSSSIANQERLLLQAEARIDQKQPEPRARHDLISASPATSSLSSSPANVERQPPECFERRKRHKTRPDLYEPFSNARKRRTRRKKSPKTQPERYWRTLRQPKTTNTGHELLNGFSADNVPPDRLTVSGFRPWHRCG